jgi:glycosyltransferase involved in cell wall biosynthesis
MVEKRRSGGDRGAVSDSRERLPISVVIPTLNESAAIADAVRSADWALEVIVADGGSTDDTAARALAAGAVVLERTGPTIGAQRNAAIERASHEWILALDADERATLPLRDQLARVIASPAYDVYRIRRENTYLGKVMRGGDMGRDWHVSFFRKAYRYNDSRVHEHLVNVAATGRLDGPLRHTPYRSLRHHADKTVLYAQWGAELRFARGERASLADLIFRAPFRFIREYVFYGGWRDGWRGAVAATMSGFSAFLRAAMLRERQ